MCPLLFVALFLFQGCSGSSAQTGTQARNEAETQHAGEHDDDDHGHHDPEHKPKNFPEAVEKLREFRTDLADRIRPESEEWEIVVDIVDWLPELAAESELNEREWNRVDGNASELRLVLQSREKNAVSWDRFDSALEKLSESVADYVAAEARFMRPLKDAETVPTPEGE